MRKLLGIIRERIKSKTIWNTNPIKVKKMATPTAEPVYHEVSADGRSEIFYLDDDHNYACKGTETIRIIRELDENGEMIREVFSFSENARPKKEELNIKPSKKVMSFLRDFVDKDGNHPFADD